MPNQNPSNLTDQLICQDAWSEVERQRYDDHIDALLNEDLNPGRRISFIVVAIFLIAMSVLCGWLALTVDKLPMVIRAMFFESVVIQLGFAAYCIHIVRQNVFHARRHPTMISGLMWCFSVFLSIHFLMVLPEVKDLRIGILFVGVSLVTMLGAGVQLLRTCIEQSELNTHERLLQIAMGMDSSRDLHSLVNPISPDGEEAQ